jgi:hypothetical protein
VVQQLDLVLAEVISFAAPQRRPETPVQCLELFSM